MIVQGYVKLYKLISLLSIIAETSMALQTIVRLCPN